MISIRDSLRGPLASAFLQTHAASSPKEIVAFRSAPMNPQMFAILVLPGATEPEISKPLAQPMPAATSTRLHLNSGRRLLSGSTQIGVCYPQHPATRRSLSKRRKRSVVPFKRLHQKPMD
jgi:hypothetical protein